MSTASGSFKHLTKELLGEASERLPGVYERLAEELGLTAGELSKAVESGRVSLESLSRAVGGELPCRPPRKIGMEELGLGWVVDARQELHPGDMAEAIAGAREIEEEIEAMMGPGDEVSDELLAGWSARLKSLGVSAGRMDIGRAKGLPQNVKIPCLGAARGELLVWLGEAEENAGG